MNAFQARLARVALGLRFTDAAKLCDVAVETIRRIEIDDSTVKEATIGKVRAAFEKAGVEFIAENGGGPGVRLKKRSETVADLTRQIDIRQTHMTPESDHEKPSPNRAMKQLRRARDQNELAVLKNRRAKSRQEENK